MKAVMGRWPKAVLQFEDFNLANAHPLLQRYRNSHLVFNDDIQARFAAIPVGALQCSWHCRSQLRRSAELLHSVPACLQSHQERVCRAGPILAR